MGIQAHKEMQTLEHNENDDGPKICVWDSSYPDFYIILLTVQKSSVQIPGGPSKT